jgi:hypothetical protein
MTLPWMVHWISSAPRQMMVIFAQVTTRSIGKLEPAFVTEDVEPDMRIIASPESLGRTCRGRPARYATRGEVPRLARPEGYYAAGPVSQSRHPRAG